MVFSTETSAVVDPGPAGWSGPQFDAEASTHAPGWFGVPRPIAALSS
jgi:hypothetical protein